MCPLPLYRSWVRHDASPQLRCSSKQLDTIILSVTDEAFSDENPEHVRIANAIEIHLADQDLLPRFADL